MTSQVTINNNNVVSPMGFGGGPSGANGFRGGSEDGMNSIAYKFFQKAMQDGKLDKNEMQTLQKLAQAEQQNRCGDKQKCDNENKEECGDKKDCNDDKKDCRDDESKDCKNGDRLLSKYIDQAMEDGRMSRFERQMINRLLESGNS
jgi:hypothetical protein